MFTKRIMMTVLLLIASSQSLPPNYFTFYDCEDFCVQNNISCIINEKSNNFIRRCTPSAAACEQEANANTACLRPGLTPIGGESIWPRFKAKYHPAAVPDNDDSGRILHFALVIGGTLLGLATMMGITLACMVFSPSKRNNYEPLNPSPHGSMQHVADYPYQPTTIPA